MKNIETYLLLACLLSTCTPNYYPQLIEKEKMSKEKAVKEKKSKKPSIKKASKLSDGNRLRKATRRPLFWILLAIIGVSIFGQISSSGNQFTKVDTSAAIFQYWISLLLISSPQLITRVHQVKLR